ncbi:MAG: MerR family transcriptional regulator [Candidatus Ventricola sp.]
MKKSLLKIGEMAALNHVSTQTLRLYAKEKLLEPEYLDPETGYRYYTLEQCAKLDLIRALKSCRLSLQQIGEIFSLSSQELLLKALEEQTGVLSDEIYNLSVSRNNLSRIQKNLRILHTLPPFGQIFFEVVPERKIDVQKTDFDFFELGHEGYEKMLRHMQNYLHENQLPPSYFINVGTIMEKECFVRGTYSSYSAFIFVDDLYPDKDSVRLLPQNTCMSIASDNIALESTYAKQLFEEMKRNGMTPCGDYLCEVLTQFPVHQAKQLIYKIQVPVQRIIGGRAR